MKTLHQNAAATAAAVLASSVLAWVPTSSWAQAGSWASVVAAAEKEGRVIVYNAATPSVQARLKADFEKAYPKIKLEATRIDSGTMVPKIEQERKIASDEVADMAISTEVRYWTEQAKQGNLVKLLGPDANAWPVKFMAVQGVVPRLAFEPIGLSYNSNLVKTPVTGYRDLLKPEFRGGKISASELAASVVAAYYDWMEKTQGAGYLQKLAAQQMRWYASGVPGTQSTAAGETAVSSFSVPSATIPLIAQGAPLKLVIPTPAFGFQYSGGVFAWSKRPNAAQVFMNYVMSRAGQTAWVGSGEAASALPNIPNSSDANSISVYDPTAYPADFLQTYRVKWNNIFKK